MLQSDGIVVAPVAPGEERAFHELYRRHPGVGLLYRQSRAMLVAAAEGDSDRIFLLAYADRPGRPLGALALLPERGRRLTCFFPIVRPGANRALVLGVLGDAARSLARKRGCLRLESEFTDTRASRRLEPGLAAMGLSLVADRLVLERPLRRELRLTDVAFVQAPEWRALSKPMRLMYESSEDPGVRSMDAGDDLELLSPEAGDDGRGAFTLLAGGEVEALALLEVRGSTGAVLFIGVVPSRQGRGAGRRMLALCLSELGRRGARTATLAVSVENRRALALYRSFGFRDRARARLYRSDVAQ